MKFNPDRRRFFGIVGEVAKDAGLVAAGGLAGYLLPRGSQEAPPSFNKDTLSSQLGRLANIVNQGMITTLENYTFQIDAGPETSRTSIQTLFPRQTQWARYRVTKWGQTEAENLSWNYNPQPATLLPDSHNPYHLVSFDFTSPDFQSSGGGFFHLYIEGFQDNPDTQSGQAENPIPTTLAVVTDGQGHWQFAWDNIENDNQMVTYQPGFRYTTLKS